MVSNYILLASLLSPVIAAVLIYFRDFKRKDQMIMAIMSLIISFLLIYSKLPAINEFGFLNEEHAWITSPLIPFDLHLDGLSFVLASLIVLVSICALFFSESYIHKKTSKFNALMLLFVTGMLGVVLSGNLIVFYLFWETMIIPVYLLIVYFGENERKADIGLKFFIFMQIGATMILFSFVGIYLVEGTFDMGMISGSAIPAWIPVLLFVGFAIKMGIFPFHNWLPDAHSEAPSPVSALLSGLMTGIGAYGMIRILYLTLHFEMHAYVSIIAVLSMLYGGIMALTQKDIKRMLAYSTISQMGYVLLGINSGVGGIVGSSLHIVGHGLAKSSLFLAAGLIIYTTGKRNFIDLGGLIRSKPILAIGVTIAALALCGLPPMLPYVSEVLIFEPALTADIGMASLAIIAGIITIIYFAVFIDKVVFGKSKKMKNLPSRQMVCSINLLALMVLLLGVLPDIVLRLITIMG